MIDDTKRTDGKSAASAEAGGAKFDQPQATRDQASEQDAQTELAALAAEAADLKDRLLRAHAEMDNIRKRSEREIADTRKYAVSQFARDMLSVGDNVQRAIDAVPAQAAEQDPALKSFLEGVSMTERGLLTALEKHGITRMSPKGELFNPHQHQAVMEAQNPEVPAGTVTQVLQAGYMIEDRVLRPAMVVVAKGGPRPVPQEPSDDSGAPPRAANDDTPAAGQSSSGASADDQDRS